jgi:hypothetical protein
MKPLLFALFLLLTATSVTAEEISSGSGPKHPFDLPTAAFMAAAGADHLTTQIALRRGGYREANPLLGFARNDANAIAVAGVFTDTATVWVTNRIFGKHPLARKLTLYGMAGLRFYVSAKNARELQR